MIKKSTLSLAFILLINIVTSSQWIQSNGLDGGKLTDIVIVDSAMFALSPEGYIYSRTENEPWQLIYNEAKYRRFNKVGPYLIAYRPFDSDVHSIRSSDMGQSWEEAPNMDDYFKIWAIDTIMFCINEDAYRSYDYGETFENFGHNGRYFYFMDNGVIFSFYWGSKRQSELQRSIDNGDTWEYISLDGIDLDCFWVEKVNVINDTLWAYAMYNCPGGIKYKELYYFDEPNEAWINADYNLPSQVNILDLIKYNGELYVTIENYPVYRFNYTDLLWEQFTDASHDANSLFVFDSTLYASCYQGLCSLDSLGNWTSYYEGMSNRDVSSINVYDEKIYVTANNELFMSDDKAVNFTQLPGINGFDLLIKNGIWYCPSIYGFNVSYDGGISWQSKSDGLSGITRYSGKCFGHSTNNLYLGTYDGMFKSNINSIEWQKILFGRVNNIATIGNSVLVELSYLAFDLYYSSNNGLSFECLNTGEHPIESLNNEFYYFTSDSIYYTVDPLDHWESFYFEPGYTIYNFDRIEDTLIGVGNSTWSDYNYSPIIYLSMDGGTSWENIRNDLPLPNIYSFKDARVKLYDNLILFDYTNLGLWYRNDLLTGQKKNNDPHTNRFEVIASPNPFSNSTKISFELEEQSLVNIQIVNVNGDVVESMSSIETSGKHQFVWDASIFPAGIYFYQIKTEKALARGKLILAH